MRWFLSPKLLIPVLSVYLASVNCCVSQPSRMQQTESQGPTQPSISQEPTQPSISQGPRIKSQLELRLEAVIENVYLLCLKDYEIQDKQVTLRIPFGQNDERYMVGEFSQQIFGGGKAEPQDIWKKIDSLLQSDDFQEYVDALQAPTEKVIFFSLAAGSWTVSTDPQEVRMLEHGHYPGDRIRVYVLKRDANISVSDIYNYLYCVGSVGMDCSGFIYYIQKSIARSLGVDLDRKLARLMKVPSEMVPQYVGFWPFDPFNDQSEEVEDVVANLRPGDIFLFRGHGGIFRHSAVIQSIDLDNGIIRYVQCTDWAPQEERGVHESFIYFDAANPEVSLQDSSVRWTQRIYPTFIGEPTLKYWKDDGDRYRTKWPTGQSLVVRLNLIKDLIEELVPTFYSNQTDDDEQLLN